MTKRSRSFIHYWTNHHIITIIISTQYYYLDHMETPSHPHNPSQSKRKITALATIMGIMTLLQSEQSLSQKHHHKTPHIRQKNKSIRTSDLNHLLSKRNTELNIEYHQWKQYFYTITWSSDGQWYKWYDTFIIRYNGTSRILTLSSTSKKWTLSYQIKNKATLQQSIKQAKYNSTSLPRLPYQKPTHGR